jgi:hypothetical protein
MESGKCNRSKSTKARIFDKSLTTCNHVEQVPEQVHTEREGSYRVVSLEWDKNYFWVFQDDLLDPDDFIDAAKKQYVVTKKIYSYIYILEGLTKGDPITTRHSNEYMINFKIISYLHSLVQCNE